MARLVPSTVRGWVIAGVVAALLAVTAGPYLYINVLKEDAPERLGFSDTSTTVAAAGTSGEQDGIEGRWTVADGSRAGYRVKEVLFGQSTEAVGRTSQVGGGITIEDTAVTVAELTVDMTSVASPEERRDRQFRGRIMATDEHPTSTFELTKPVELDAVPAVGETITRPATGRFTIRGVTREVTFDLSARRGEGSIEVTGSIPVVFADFDIPDATFGPAVVEDHGEIEFLVALRPA